MHPPLDRPHPDCQDVIDALKACHEDSWKKFTGGCNKAKFDLDKCFKAEKQRMLDEENQGWQERQQEQQLYMKDIFGRKETFAEYLQKDKDYQKAKERNGS